MADLMKSFPKIEKMTKLEILLLFVFVIYLIFPIGTPDILKSFIISPMGYVTIFIVTLYLFFYSHPILAILYIFVAYELLNRSNKIAQLQHASNMQRKQVSFNEQDNDNELNKNSEMVSMNPLANVSLEEEIVNTNVPVGVSQSTTYVTTSFQPITDKIGSASNYM